MFGVVYQPPISRKTQNDNSGTADLRNEGKTLAKVED